MVTVYFTYGSDDSMPFVGGWTEITAENRDEAENLFRLIHPSKNGMMLNCAFVYDEDTFKKSSMYTNGNFGRFCHERIKLDIDRSEKLTVNVVEGV